MKIVALFAVLLIVPVVVAFVYLPWYYALVVVAGVVFIGPRLVRAVFVRGARRIVRAVGSEMMLDGQPEHITLERQDAPGLTNALVDELVAAGFSRVGDFRIPEMERIEALVGLAHPVERCYAVAYQVATGDVIVDLAARAEDGHEITVTTSPPSLADPPHKTTIRCNTADVPVMLEEVRRFGREGAALEPAPAEEFETRFVQSYEREMASRRKMGLDLDEMARAMGKPSDGRDASHKTP